MNTLTVLAEATPVLSALLPMQIDIDPNSSGLPGINQLAHHRRRGHDRWPHPQRVGAHCVGDRVGIRRK